MLYLTLITFAGIIWLIVLYTYFYSMDKRIYFRLWDLSWGVSLITYLCVLFDLQGNHTELIIGVGQIFFFLEGLFLIWGTVAFLGKKVKKWAIIAYGTALIWLIAGKLAHFSFLLSSFPSFELNSVFYLWIGIVLIRWKIKGIEKYIVGYTSCLWGIHQGIYPFFHQGVLLLPWEQLIAVTTGFMISIGMLTIYLQKSREELARREKSFRLLAENAQDLIYRYRVTPNPGFEYVSPASYTITGYTPDEFYKDPQLFYKLGNPGELDALNVRALRLLSDGPKIIKLDHKDGKEVWVELHITLVHDKAGALIAVEGIARDITERKWAEEEMGLQKVYFKQLFENCPDGIVILDNENRVIDVNRGFEELFQYGLEEIKGCYIDSIIVPEHLAAESGALTQKILNGNTIQLEAVRRRKDGSVVDVSIVGYPIIFIEKIVGIYGIYSDITCRKKVEEQLKYLSLRDQLTGLYNRTFFEQELQRLDGEKFTSLGIIVCDVDGLKIFNDTLGHSSGDELLKAAANAIRGPFRNHEVVARIGGDEFAIILPDGTPSIIEKAISQIREKISDYNGFNLEFPLSISMGFATCWGISKSITETFNEADNNMYREKLSHGQSARSAIVQTLIKTLEARDFITEGHASRLQDLVSRIAEIIGLSKREISDLRLLAQFHDIGKVGIPDRILFKNGPLTPEETIEMRRHCEIGSRIAYSSRDLAPIADWILKHHEWWNGEGYPFRLAGEDIPLQCRIISIVDAFDAMTHNRPYRNALTVKEALAELRKCSGTQFDPYLVPIFEQIIVRKVSIAG
jgi:diguanylate cyclase (GGDEF)-like protein/PAS domain S-box-containing protein